MTEIPYEEYPKVLFGTSLIAFTYLVVTYAFTVPIRIKLYDDKMKDYDKLH